LLLRRYLVTAAVLVAGVVLVAAVPAPALADPAGPDGGNATLQTQLDAAARGYNDAKGRLDTAKARQAQLTAQAQATGAELATLNTHVQALAVAAYKGGRISSLTVLLSSGSAGDFLDRATNLQTQLRRDNDALRRLHDAQARYDQQRAAINTEVATQQNQLTVMDKRKKDAQAALSAASGGAPAGGPSGGAATASPAPRNPDGSWPKESCSVKDPTTSRCLTPRTLHALQEVQKAGFTHFVSCFRDGTWGEHPLGRACDFAANAKDFVNAAATGADKAYGDRLAAWLIGNADRLAVLYIIWYRQIWMPGTGWRTYHGDGTPAGDHMNHVHLSIQ
jgi:hypothetical protein